MFIGISEGIAGVTTVLAATALALAVRTRGQYMKARRAHREVARSAAELEESSSEAIVTVDAGGRIRSFNPAAQALFGYRPREVHGQPFVKLLGPNVASPSATASQPHEAQGEALRKDGTTVPVRLRVASSKSSPPEVKFFIEDLTRQQTGAPRPEDQSESASVAAALAVAKDARPADHLAATRQTLRTIERVAGRIAGHFENLLSTINGYSELVLHDLSPASPLRKDVEQILEASKRASETTRQLLGFSGNRLISTEPLDLNRLLERMKRNANERIRHSIELRLTEEPVAALGNREALESMLAVLAEYASVHAHRPVFTVETARLSPAELGKVQPALPADLIPGDYVKLSVSLGQTPEEEVLQHLLEPFGSPMPGARHSAFGLAVLNEAVGSTGGAFSPVRSDGQTTLNVWLPAAGAAAEASSEESRASIARAGS